MKRKSMGLYFFILFYIGSRLNDVMVILSQNHKPTIADRLSFLTIDGAYIFICLYLLMDE